MLVAQQPDAPAVSKSKMSALSLLPDGSQLKGVMLPRYDEDHNLVEVLKAKTMILLNSEQIAGETVAIEFFNEDHSPRGRVDLTKATFYHARRILEARETVDIKSDRYMAHGCGLYYAFEEGKGFLLGPATSIIQAPTETTMKSPSSPLRATALAGMALIAQPLNAAPIQAMTSEETAALQTDAASKATAAAEASKLTRTDLRATLSDSQETDKKAAEFLDKADLLAAESKDKGEPVAAQKPLDIKPGPEDTVITCDGGMYFDADAGVLVYLKNVKVNSPDYDLSGANELKIFFGKKPAKEPKAGETADEKKADEKAKNGLENMGANIGDVERVIATGAVLIHQKRAKDGNEPIDASGAIFSYNIKTGQIVISGGYPWFTQGTKYMRALEPNLSLRIDQKTNNAITEGRWEQSFPLNEKK